MQNNQKWSPALAPHDNNDITTWELPENAIARLAQGRGIMGNIAPSPDGKYLAVGSCIGVWWYDVSTMTPIALWDTARGYISAVSFSPNGKWLATGDGDGLVKVWDMQRGVCVSQMERDETEKPYHCVSRFAFSPDSQCLAVSSIRDYILYVWHPETGEQIAKFHGETNFRWFGGTRRPVAFSPCSTLIALGQINPSEILLWDINRRDPVMSIPQPKDSSHPFALAFSPCGRYLASGAWWIRGFGIKKCPVLLWDVESGENIAAFRGHPTDIQCLAFSSDGTILASGGYGGTIMLWDMKPYIGG